MKKLIYEFDPWEETGVTPPKSMDKKREAMAEIAEFVETSAIEFIASGKSPVAGGSWKRTLSKDYKERKVAAGGQSFADMELEGDMLQALKATVKNTKKIQYGINDPVEGPKADGHNNFSGASELPPREFIPKSGETFRREIIRGVRQIAQSYEDDDD